MNYKPGKEIKGADALSRAHLQDSRTEIPDMEFDFVVHSVISSLPISPKRLNDFKQETTKGDVLQKLKDFTVNGWPEKKNVPLEVRPYFNCRDEISYSHGLLLKGEKIIVPSSLHKDTLELKNARPEQETHFTGLERIRKLQTLLLQIVKLV